MSTDLNRIIATLADLVVAVECHGPGGSFPTGEAAARRAVPECAVLGSVRCPASHGTNGLLVDGCVPVRDLGDVLTALALARDRRRIKSIVRGRAGGRSTDRRVHGLDRVERAVWESVDDTPTPVETV